MRTALAVLLAAVAGAAAAVQVTGGEAAADRCRASPSERAIAAGGTPSLLADSVAARGNQDIALAWLDGPTTRYAHAALGNNVHASTLNGRVRGHPGVVSLSLPPDRVFEDRRPRLVDLDGDGRDELIVVEASQRDGAALVVYAIDSAASAPRWVERARSEPVGAMRWLNPVGAADFDGRGPRELASVVTPHIGGVLTLYRYAPPRLVAISRFPGVANHRMGTPEQRLSAVLAGRSGAVAVVPDRAYAQLLFLGWSAAQGWHDTAAPLRLAAPLVRVEAVSADAACVILADGTSLLLQTP